MPCTGSALFWVAVLFTLLGASPVALAEDPAQLLRARHLALVDELASNPFSRPLYLESRETKDTLEGEIYALVEQPFAVVDPSLQGIGHWCDILILHVNVKGCRNASPQGDSALSLSVGRKFEQPLADAYQFEFRYQVVASTPDYVHVQLTAPVGPMDTRDYRIALEVVGIDAQRSFLHLSYSYAFGLAARMAMQGYLATTGRDKVGFSIIGRNAQGQPVYVGSTLGVVERNTMRYYLAIEAYLGALSAPAPDRLEQRLKAWHVAVERYPLQLHDLELGEYLDMKRKEIRRQQAVVVQ
ncbi:hypothetical protein [Pseudomonas sp. OTU5201]|uniref:hypothetical protein n=1 Tax=Pseudomonas sp. OTU5201 TaxID=3043850 RepID=UPI00313B7AC6